MCAGAVFAVAAGGFADYERVYVALRARVGGDTQRQVAQIVGSWQTDLAAVNRGRGHGWCRLHQLGGVRGGGEHLLTTEDLQEWLNGELDTSPVAWNDWPRDRRLRATILAQDTDFVAITRNGRLDNVVSRDPFALAIARTTVTAQQRSAPPSEPWGSVADLSRPQCLDDG